MRSKNKQIVILGGGYAGVMAAVRLAGKTKRLNTKVTLVNGVGHFVERPRLHEQATGTRLAVRPLAQMLVGTSASFLQGWVTAIRPEQKTVSVQTGTGDQQLVYDRLVVALGSRVERQSVTGVDEHAFTLDPDGELTAGALARKLDSLRERQFRTVVVGGGPTGIEAAAQIKAICPGSEVGLVTQHERLLQGFIEVVELGEVDAFLNLLAEEVTFVPDGGGQRGAAIRVLRGREAVAHFIMGVQRLAPPDLRYELAWLNGQQALLSRTVDGQPFFALFIYSQAGLVHLIHVIAGRKLAALERLS